VDQARWVNTRLQLRQVESYSQNFHAEFFTSAERRQPMPTVREQARQTWAQEKQRREQSEQKKKKRRAKRIEADIDELLPRDTEDFKYDRILGDPGFGVIVSITDRDGSLQFTYDDKDNLVMIGACPGCRHPTWSQPIRRLEDLGAMIDQFESASSHECSN
jgi:uncharacterized FlaG/YvyC family protein